MPLVSRSLSTATLILALLALLALSAAAHADDSDALALESAPVTEAKSAAQPTRVFIEATVGRIGQRYGLAALDAHRLSIDFVHQMPLPGGWRAVLSDRLDNSRPAGAGTPATLNSLREAYASWQNEGGNTLVELGRINLRNGPAYGYNPTDYFRDGALRSVTTADPLALRENRLGTVMLRAQQLWAGGAVSLALAPKLADGPNSGSFSADIGSTNARNRALASWSTRLSDGISTQLLVLGDQGRGTHLGASATALLSDAAVAHVEASRGRSANLLADTLGSARAAQTRNRLAAGLTYTLPTRLALTAEFDYNGAAPDSTAWQAAAAAGGPALLGRYLQAVQVRQESASRRAWLLYANQKDVLLKSLDFTALLRINADDHSRLAWVELRYHWGQADVALQWQRTLGQALSEYGVLPYRQALQVLGAWYF